MRTRKPNLSSNGIDEASLKQIVKKQRALELSNKIVPVKINKTTYRLIPVRK